MKKVSKEIIGSIVIVALFLILMALLIIATVCDDSSKQTAFENFAGVVIEKYDGDGLEFNRITVDIPYRVLLGDTSCKKQYLVSDEIFDTIELGSLYDGSSALGYVRERSSIFDISEKYIFYWLWGLRKW